VSTNGIEDAEDTVDAGEDFLDEFGRIIVNVVDSVVFVGMLPPPVRKTLQIFLYIRYSQ
jgi:hypothetical protein